MNSDHEYIYYIPENIEDENLRSAAFMTKEVVKENIILKDILQKYVVEYNENLEESCSSMSLQVMNQNHKLVFSTIASPRMKESLNFSSFSAKMDANVSCLVEDQLCSPLKKNRTVSSLERKRLTFDVEENEYMKSLHVITEYPDEDHMHSDTFPSFSTYEEAKLYDNPEEAFNFDEIPECVDTLSIYDEDAINMSTKTPDKDQTMFITPEKKNRTPENYIMYQSIAPFIKYIPPCFSDEPNDSKSLDTDLNSDDEYDISERFNLEGKPETVTSLATYDQDDTYPLAKTPDNHQMMTSSSEEKNSTLAKYAIDDRKSVSPSFLNSTKMTRAFEKHNTNEQISFCPEEKNETVSNQPIIHLETLRIPYKTPEKLQTSPVNANKEEGTHINQILVKKAALKFAINDKVCSSPMEDVETSNNPQMKTVDYAEAMRTSLISEDQEFSVLPKMPKINKGLAAYDEEVTFSADSIMKSNDSVCSEDKSPMDTKISFQFTDYYDMDCNDSFNHPDDDFIADKDFAQFNCKANVSALASNMYVSRAKKYESQIYQASATQDCTSLLSPEVDLKKMTLEVESDASNTKYDKIKIGARDRKDESLANLTQKTCPSVKRASMCTSPSREFFPSDDSSAKPDNWYDKVEKFTERLKQRKSRFSMYLHLFVEDQHDLRFIITYIHRLAAVIDQLFRTDNNQVLMKDFYDFANKGTYLLNKASSWHLDLVRDLQVWEVCIQKINEIQQDIRQIYGEKTQDMIAKDFQTWEASFRIVNKKADDMTLLREVRRPSIIQFGYELEILIKSFIQTMLAKGLLKRCSRVS